MCCALISPESVFASGFLSPSSLNIDIPHIFHSSFSALPLSLNDRTYIYKTSSSNDSGEGEFHSCRIISCFFLSSREVVPRFANLRRLSFEFFECLETEKWSIRNCLNSSHANAVSGAVHWLLASARLWRSGNENKIFYSSDLVAMDDDTHKTTHETERRGAQKQHEEAKKVCAKIGSPHIWYTHFSNEFSENFTHVSGESSTLCFDLRLCRKFPIAEYSTCIFFRRVSDSFN